MDLQAGPKQPPLDIDRGHGNFTVEAWQPASHNRHMRKDGKRVLAIACAAIGLIWVPIPTFGQTNANTLQEWAYILATRNPAWAYTNAQLAVRRLGTNAIPPLLEWLSHNPPDREYSLSNPSPEALEDARRFQLANAAVNAFGALGDLAIPAIPALSNIAMLDGHSAPRAVQAMANIGPAALPSLLAILTNVPPRTSGSVPFAIMGLGTNARPAIPALILCLTNSALREEALRSLTYLAANGMERELILPAIFRLASDPDPRARTWAIRMLPTFGQDAREALPQLLAALNDPDKNLRFTATEALKQIAPEVLTNAPPR